MRESTIALEGMEFYACHGCFAEEKIVGTYFTVNLYMKLDIDKAIKNDCIEDTINYVQIYALVKEVMSESVNLIEHLAGKIIEKLKKEFPQILSIEIKLSKNNPPIGEKLSCVSVIINA